MSSYVLDASAILAMLQNEPGGEAVLDLLSTGEESIAISAVNYAEVIGKLCALATPTQLELITRDIRRHVQVFSIEQASRAGTLIVETRKLGLSLADRACLSLALALEAEVWTTDKAWSKLKLPITIRVLR